MEIDDYIVASDSTLVDLASAGDQQAFEYLFIRYRDALMRLFEQRLDEKTMELVQQGVNPIWSQGVTLSVTSEESKLINFDNRPKVILSASGMCEAGRIRHHLKHNLWRPESVILFVGYQAEHTLGRKLQDGVKSVKLFGEEIAVRAQIATLNGTSGHADRDGLLNWLAGFREKPQQVFVNHGDHEACGAFTALLRELGYGVTEYASRYLRGEPKPPMRRHRVLKVQAVDGCWLCDVGIGEVAQREPIEMVEGLEQHQFGETYKLEKEDFFGWVLWDFHKGAWRKFYSFTEEPQLLVDFIAGNFYCEKHPDSPFNNNEMFALKTLEGRTTLDGHIYKEFKADEVLVKELSDEEMPWAYGQFGLKYE